MKYIFKLGWKRTVAWIQESDRWAKEMLDADENVQKMLLHGDVEAGRRAGFTHRVHVWSRGLRLHVPRPWETPETEGVVPNFDAIPLDEWSQFAAAVDKARRERMESHAKTYVPILALLVALASTVGSCATSCRRTHEQRIVVVPRSEAGPRAH